MGLEAVVCGTGREAGWACWYRCVVYLLVLCWGWVDCMWLWSWFGLVVKLSVGSELWGWRGEVLDGI